MTFEGCVPRAVFAGKNTSMITQSYYPNPRETVIIIRMLLTHSALEHTFQRQLRPTLFSTNIGL